MHLTETSLWLWTCTVWERVKCGLMGRVLEGIGQHMPMVTAMSAVIPEHSGPQNVNLVVVNQLSDGNHSITYNLLLHINLI